jgi:nitroreductase
MDVVEAIRQRKSVRGFKPDTVPEETLREIMEVALRAPSWANTQPWEFAIVRGEMLEDIRQTFVEKTQATEPTNPDLAAPAGFPEPFDGRRRAVGRKLFEVMDIGREDREKRMWWGLQGLRLFEAPAVIYIYTERVFYSQEGGLNVWPVFDCGLVAQNIMLLAVEYGLGTIPAIQAVMYPDVLRNVLGIPDSKLIVLGIAIGYPDPESPTSEFYSEREPLDSVTEWYGFG